MSNLPEPVARALRKERDELIRQRALAIEKLDKEIAAIDSFLAAPNRYTRYHELAHVVLSSHHVGAHVTAQHRLAGGGDPVAFESIGARAVNQLAIEHCRTMLEGGKQLKTSELHAAVLEANIRLKAEDPERRLVQLLSENKDIFQSDRRNGWSLKSESAVGAALSGASESSSEDAQP